MSIPGTGGILNIGFTCYANAVIQAFRHCNTFDTLFQEEIYSKNLKEDCKYSILTKQFANLIQNISKITTSSSIKPMGFWYGFEQSSKDTGFEHLNRRAPHDAHEFLMFLLDSIHESLSKKLNLKITKIELKTERQKLHQMSLESWKEQFENSYSPLVPLLFGLFHVQTECSNCKNLTNKFETFNTLKGVMHNEKKLTLIESILDELNEEIIDEYACDKCSPTRHKAIRKTKIWKLPPTLIVVLKRFTFDGRKIYTPLEDFKTEEPINISNIYSPLSPDKEKQNMYQLRSIVDHHGGPNGGHYTAQAKHRSENKWFNYDDQTVSEINKPDIGSSTYILILEKSN
jgi:ubiquitin carboxyl-terminal hydrolase 8